MSEVGLQRMNRFLPRLTDMWFRSFRQECEGINGAALKGRTVQVVE